MVTVVEVEDVLLEVLVEPGRLVVDVVVDVGKVELVLLLADVLELLANDVVVGTAVLVVVLVVVLADVDVV